MFLVTGSSRLNRALPGPACDSASASEKPVIDVSVLCELFDDSFEAVSALLNAASASLLEDLTKIEAAIVADEASTVADAAHRLKGTSGTIRATRLTTAGSVLEATARRGSLSATSPFVVELREAVGLTIDAIASYVGPHHSAERAP